MAYLGLRKVIVICFKRIQKTIFANIFHVRAHTEKRHARIKTKKASLTKHFRAYL